MKPTRIPFLSALSALGLALAVAPGCGGCESCFGEPSAGDDAAMPIATATATIAPVAVVDAALEVSTANDAGNDAAPEEVVVPRASSPPRPKGPMPVGAFQSCGRYDGPRCEKACPNGNCRQECDGVDCLLTCEKGYCSQMCGASATCRMTCLGGHCIQACTKPEGCIRECAGGNCE